MSNLFDKLQSLKDKLAHLEDDYTHEIKEEEKTNAYKIRIEKKLPFIKEMQKSKVIINTGGEAKIITSRATIQGFGYILSLKDDLNSMTNTNEILIDASYELFYPIMEIIRHNLTEEVENKYSITVKASPLAIRKLATQFFGDDTNKILENYELNYICPFTNKEESKVSEKKLSHKWEKGVYILCYSCGNANDGSFNRKLLSHERADDNYVKDKYYATCMNCDPSGTLCY